MNTNANAAPWPLFIKSRLIHTRDTVYAVYSPANESRASRVTAVMGLRFREGPSVFSSGRDYARNFPVLICNLKSLSPNAEINKGEAQPAEIRRQGYSSGLSQG